MTSAAANPLITKEDSNGRGQQLTGDTFLSGLTGKKQEAAKVTELFRFCSGFSRISKTGIRLFRSKKETSSSREIFFSVAAKNRNCFGAATSDRIRKTNNFRRGSVPAADARSVKFGVDGPAIRNSVVLCNLLPLVLRKCGTHYKSIKVSVAGRRWRSVKKELLSIQMTRQDCHTCSF